MCFAIIFLLCLCCYLICIISLVNQVLKQRRQAQFILSEFPFCIECFTDNVVWEQHQAGYYYQVFKTRRPCGKRRSQRTVPLAYASSKQQPITTSKCYFQRCTLKNKLSNQRQKRFYSLMPQENFFKVQKRSFKYLDFDKCCFKRRVFLFLFYQMIPIYRSELYNVTLGTFLIQRAMRPTQESDESDAMFTCSVNWVCKNEWKRQAFFSVCLCSKSLTLIDRTLPYRINIHKLLRFIICAALSFQIVLNGPGVCECKVAEIALQCQAHTGLASSLSQARWWICVQQCVIKCLSGHCGSQEAE